MKEPTDPVLDVAIFALLDPRRRELIRRAGALLAAHLATGGASGSPLLGNLAAVSEELQLARRMLAEIAHPGGTARISPREADLCQVAAGLAGALAEVGAELTVELQRTAPGSEGLEQLARRLAAEHPSPEARAMYERLADCATAKLTVAPVDPVEVERIACRVAATHPDLAGGAEGKAQERAAAKEAEPKPEEKPA